MAVSVGDRLPDFNLEDQDGVTRSSSSRQQQPLVLFFYPKDDTPGCTAEACGFRDSFSRFQELGAEVWGVSGVDAISHRRFAERYSLPFPLLSDRGNALRQQMGVPKALGLIPGRVTYIVDAGGVVRHIFSNLLDGPAHVKEAERVLSTLITA